jgi:hypothetical protein
MSWRMTPSLIPGYRSRIVPDQEECSNLAPEQEVLVAREIHELKRAAAVKRVGGARNSGGVVANRSSAAGPGSAKERHCTEVGYLPETRSGMRSPICAAGASIAKPVKADGLAPTPLVESVNSNEVTCRTRWNSRYQDSTNRRGDKEDERRQYS